MRPSLLIALLLALGACQQKSAEEPAGSQVSASAGESGIKGVHRDQKGKLAPDPSFQDADGKSARIADFKGKPLLVNLWASWCAPCVKELPTLDRLSRSGRIRVLAVSEDSGPHASVVAFLKEHGVNGLQPYQDPAMRLSGALGPDTVLPTSMLFDANGREVWRYVGDLDWTGPEAAKLLAETGGPAKQD